MGKKFTTAAFDTEVLASDKPTLVDFYADWCGPCKMLAPLVEELATEYAGKANVGKVNIDEEEELAMRYGVMSIPTLIVFHKGEVVAKAVGVQSREAIEEMIAKAK